jgi:hypothetical protein
MFGGTGFSSLMGGDVSGDSFPSPWRDQATLSMPENFHNALWLCEYVFYANPTYARAQQRLISYFLTDIDANPVTPNDSLGEDERSKWTSYLTETVGMIGVLGRLNLDMVCYGNAFASLHVPFKRMLISKKSGKILAFREMADRPDQFGLSYDADKNKFMAKDPDHGRCEWTIYDIPGDETTIKIWSPKEMCLVHDPWSWDCSYYWKVPANYKREIRRGNMHMLERAPEEILKAVKDDYYFRFDPDTIFHMKEPTLSGVDMRGWGLSRTLAIYRDIWHVQVLRRYNEAIALDYVVPFRVLTPDAQVGAQGTNEPLRMLNMGDWSSQVRKMLRQRRRDPASWHTLPFPVKYQAIGGDATQLAPSELLDQGTDIMLNAAGVPAELYRGTLQFNVAPVALRLFESTHYQLVHGNNDFLRWFVGRVTQLQSLPAVKLEMRKVTNADDMTKTMAELQMFMGGQLSGTTSFRGLGRDWRAEQKQIAEEEMFRQKTKADVEEQMQQSQFGDQILKGQPGGAAGGDPSQAGGAAPAGGAPPAADGTQPVGTQSADPVADTITSLGNSPSPEDIASAAESLSDQLLQMPDPQRNSQMRELKQQNPTLHSLTKVRVEDKRRQIRNQGGQMLGLGGGGGAGGGGAPPQGQ